MMMFRPM